jgi:mono/diheme cytochrome c family protein
MQPNHFFRNCAVFLLAIVALCGSRGVAGESLQRPSGSDGAVAATESSAAGLAGFRRDVEPVLQAACLECHGPDASEGNFRVDTIDPDLIHGEDLEWWRDVFAVLTKEEMPPVDADPLADADRVRVVNWLARELQQASRAQRAAGGRSSLRRMTRYEFGYALQDLLELPFDFARDLPPDAVQTDGFENGADTLQVSVGQFMAFHEAARAAFARATVRGEQPPPRYWSITMEQGAAGVWPDEPTPTPAKHPRPYYKQRSTGQTAVIQWAYPEAKYAWLPADSPTDLPADSDVVGVIPPQQRLTVELGDRVPDAGQIEIRVRVSRPDDASGPPPSLQLEFGWQASNDSQASVRISPHDERVEAPSSAPQTVTWRVHASEILPRNMVRGINKLGDLPNPSEFLRLVNSSVSTGDIEVHAVEVAGPLYDTWPPASHTQLLGSQDLAALTADEALPVVRARLRRFMERAWRRPVTPDEVDRKVALFTTVRATADDLQEAVVETLAAVIASPNFLYLTGPEHVLTGPEHVVDAGSHVEAQALEPAELATRLAMLLWCSLPDEPLRVAAAEGALAEPGAVAEQARRLLADPRSHRFCEQFTRQWLDLDRLAYLEVDRKVYPAFDPSLVEAMRSEPATLFAEMLREDRSVGDLLDADYVMVNERLARHYGIGGVDGNAFREVALEGDQRRGGLLTQAGLLAMNADGVDSHPLKRGVWLLERLLDDPPPPPPPAVPRIDLADPEIAKLTLKERLLDHRNQAACRSCHERIDPWGIALENYDAIGGWRTEMAGKPVDATSKLFNGDTLEGVVGLKTYLREHRADQFRRAMVHKLARYALGRPLTFADHDQVEAIAARLDERGDGLATMIQVLVESDLFRSR